MPPSGSHTTQLQRLSIRVGDDDNLRYTYDATGNKLAKIVDGTNAQNNTRIDYSGNFLYENNDLKAIFTSAGRIVPFNNNGEVLYKFEYNLQDHLGNTRVVFGGHSNGQPEVMQVTDYYPFGLVMYQQNYFADGVLSNKYLYNGKELQDDELAGNNLGWYDYGARMYDPAIGRWHVADPMSVVYLDLSPYIYVANNPLKFTDPTGMLIDDYAVDKDGKVEKIKDTEDDYDVLYAAKTDSKRNVVRDSKGKMQKKDTDGDGKVSESDGTTVNDRTILPALSKTGVDGYDGRWASNNSLTDIGNIFLFAAANTNVEWGFSSFKEGGESTYVVSTSHDNSRVSNVARLGQFDEMNLTYKLHSHPDADGYKGASYAGGVGDWYNIQQYYIRWIKAGKDGNKFPTHGVYHKYSRTIYYYTPWERSKKGHTFTKPNM